MTQFERERITTCTGVVGKFSEERSNWVRQYPTDLAPVQQVFVRLREVDGVLDIDCPFYGESRECLQAENIPTSKEYGYISTEPCKFAPTTAVRTQEAVESAFEEPHYFQMVLDRLSPKARFAAFEMNKYCFDGMGKDHFYSMCYVFDLAKSHEDSQQILDELCEMGLVMERSRLEALREALAQLEDGTYEEMDLVNNGQKAADELKGHIEREIHEYFNPTPGRFREYLSYVEPKTPEAWQRAENFIREETEGWDTPATHVRFIPGFQRFLNQFYSDEWGMDRGKKKASVKTKPIPAVQNLSFIEDLMRDTDGDESGEM